MTNTQWFVAVNTFTPGRPVGYTVLSSHRTAQAAIRACRSVQPRERGSYLPVDIRLSDKRLTCGDVIGCSDYPSYDEWWQL